MHRAALAVAAAAALLVLAAGPAAAQIVEMQGSQVGIRVKSDRQAALIQAIAAGFAQAEENQRLNRTGPVIQAAVSAQPPPVPNASPAEVRSAVVAVMAAASIQSEALGSLGEPSVFK